MKKIYFFLVLALFYITGNAQTVTTFTLNSGVKYVLKLYRNTRQQNQPYLILSIVLSDSSLSEKYTFSQDF